jgi:hypothetical protein
MEEIVGRRKDHGFPLHAKPVTGTVNRQALEKMDSSGKWAEASRWLWDERIYQRLLRRSGGMRGVMHSRITESDMEILVGLARYEHTAPETIRAWAKAFCREEIDKRRRRHLLEPALNDIITKGQDFPEIELPTYKEIRKNIRRWSIQFDFMSWYDQFSLTDEVASYFGVRHKRNTYRYRTLPMGFRPSCWIAQTAAEILARTGVEVYCAIYIDNVLFSSDKQENVVEAARIFMQRCSEAGVRINDPDLTLEQRLQEKFDFLGVSYDCVARTARNTEKTMAKLRAARDQLVNKPVHSYRQTAAFVGLLFFAESIVPTTPAAAYHALKHFRQTVNNPLNWDAVAPNMPHIVRREFICWIDDHLRGNSTPLDVPDNESEATAYVDASAFGWGGIITDHLGNVRTVGGEWSAEDRRSWNLGSSVAAEPLALVKLIQAYASTESRHIRVFSDHLPLVYAFRAKWAKAHSYNAAILVLQNTFPLLRLSLEFVPGVDNIIADRISRGAVEAGGETLNEERITGITGSGLTWVPPASVRIRSPPEAGALPVDRQTLRM